ncbi:MAG: CheB methylesterase domain-containing protein [Pseudomonadota bacterium]
MRVLIADPDDRRREQATTRLGRLPGVQLSAACADLSATFDIVEHRPPHVVLYAQSFTQQPEFETMETLCRHLSVRWMTFSIGTCRTPHNLINVDLAADEAAILSTLQAKMNQKAAAARGPQIGLFHSTFPSRSSNIVLIGSSTGGVDALLQVLGTFPADCPPTLVVQHTGASFSAGLARLLNARVEPKVIEAYEGAMLASGTIMIAPGADAHLVLNAQHGTRCRLEVSPRMNGHRPSVDALFKSAARVADRVTAVLLTGMGRDGAEGLLDLKTAGAQTIAQDKATSLVYGMPGAAADLGAVNQKLPLSAIGPAILKSSQQRGC